MAAQPKTRRTELTTWQIGMLKESFAESGNMSRACRDAGVSWALGHNYIKKHFEEFMDHRKEKMGDTLTTLVLVRRLALEELTDPDRLARASTHELAVLAGIMTDKINVISGSPTSRLAIEATGIHAVALSPENRELARKLRDQMLANGAHPKTLTADRGVIEATGRVTG